MREVGASGNSETREEEHSATMIVVMDHLFLYVPVLSPLNQNT